MAYPPEPLPELLARAATIVDAEVVEVIETGPPPPSVQPGPGYTSTGQKSAAERVRLRVGRVLRGDSAPETVVDKPLAPYILSVGNHGIFMLDDQAPVPQILGRYGPDSYPTADVEAAVADSD